MHCRFCDLLTCIDKKFWKDNGDHPPPEIYWLAYSEAHHCQHHHRLPSPHCHHFETHEGQAAWAGAGWVWFSPREGWGSPGSNWTAASPPSAINQREKLVWKLWMGFTFTRVMPLGLGRSLGGGESSICSSSIGTPATMGGNILFSLHENCNDYQTVQYIWPHSECTWLLSAPIGALYATIPQHLYTEGRTPFKFCTQPQAKVSRQALMITTQHHWN